jgi:uncharacterized membrane protein
MLKKKLAFWKDKPGFKQVLILGSIFFVLLLALALNRYYSFGATYDHGLFDQVFWNSIHGKLFQSSLSSVASSDHIIDHKLPLVNYIHLGQHFVIDFLLWMPLYALFPSPVTLVILQVILITVAGLILYPLARHYLSIPLSVMIVASYYGANAVIGPTLDNFYEHCQIPLFIFGLLLALEKQKWWLFWGLVALTLGVREDTGITLFGIGLYLVFSRRYPRLGLALCTISFGAVALITNFIMPLFSPDSSRLYLASYFSKFVKSEHPSSLELLWAIISQPQIILEVLVTNLDKRIRYLLGQGLPLAFVTAFSWQGWIMSLFPFLVIFLQLNNPLALSINSRYTLSVVPVIFYGAILWWAENGDKFQPKMKKIWVGCIGLSLFFMLTSNPNRALYFLIPHSIQPWVYVSLNQQWEHAINLKKSIALIPRDASVSTTAYIVPHLSNRRAILRLTAMQYINDEGKIKDIDYAVVDIWQLRQPELVAPVDRERIQKIIPFIDQGIVAGTLGVISVIDGTVVIQRGVTTPPEVLPTWLELRKVIDPLLKGDLR